MDEIFTCEERDRHIRLHPVTFVFSVLFLLFPIKESKRGREHLDTRIDSTTLISDVFILTIGSGITFVLESMIRCSMLRCFHFLRTGFRSEGLPRRDRRPCACRPRRGRGASGNTANPSWSGLYCLVLVQVSWWSQLSTFHLKRTHSQFTSINLFVFNERQNGSIQLTFTKPYTLTGLLSKRWSRNKRLFKILSKNQIYG